MTIAIVTKRTRQDSDRRDTLLLLETSLIVCWLVHHIMAPDSIQILTFGGPQFCYRLWASFGSVNACRANLITGLTFGAINREILCWFGRQRSFHILSRDAQPPMPRSTLSSPNIIAPGRGGACAQFR